MIRVISNKENKRILLFNANKSSTHKKRKIAANKRALIVRLILQKTKMSVSFSCC
jgi:DNA-binding CsgD family transcriptional regulator